MDLQDRMVFFENLSMERIINLAAVFTLQERIDFLYNLSEKILKLRNDFKIELSYHTDIYTQQTKINWFHRKQ